MHPAAANGLADGIHHSMQVASEFDSEFGDMDDALDAALLNMERLDVRVQRLAKLLAEKSIEYHNLVSKTACSYVESSHSALVICQLIVHSP